MFGETRKWQNILPIPKLENVEKMHWAHVLEAQMPSIYHVTLIDCSTHSLDIKTRRPEPAVRGGSGTF